VPASRAKGPARPALQVSNFQPVERDFAFVVDSQVEAEAILRAARGADRKLIESVEAFDVFAGRRAAEQLGQGRKSVAIAVRLQPREATLTEAEIEAVSTRIIEAVAKATGAELRR
jgi:phenylalanyl-tRNA synthetase beta chain